MTKRKVMFDCQSEIPMDVVDLISSDSEGEDIIDPKIESDTYLYFEGLVRDLPAHLLHHINDILKPIRESEKSKTFDKYRVKLFTEHGMFKFEFRNQEDQLFSTKDTIKESLGLVSVGDSLKRSWNKIKDLVSGAYNSDEDSDEDLEVSDEIRLKQPLVTKNLRIQNIGSIKPIPGYVHFHTVLLPIGFHSIRSFVTYTSNWNMQLTPCKYETKIRESHGSLLFQVTTIKDSFPIDVVQDSCLVNVWRQIFESMKQLVSENLARNNATLNLACPRKSLQKNIRSVDNTTIYKPGFTEENEEGDEELNERKVKQFILGLNYPAKCEDLRVIVFKDASRQIGFNVKRFEDGAFPRFLVGGLSGGDIGSMIQVGDILLGFQPSDYSSWVKLDSVYKLSTLLNLRHRPLSVLVARNQRFVEDVLQSPVDGMLDRYINKLRKTNDKAFLYAATLSGITNEGVQHICQVLGKEMAKKNSEFIPYFQRDAVSRICHVRELEDIETDVSGTLSIKCGNQLERRMCKLNKLQMKIEDGASRPLILESVSKDYKKLLPVSLRRETRSRDEVSELGNMLNTNQPLFSLEPMYSVMIGESQSVDRMMDVWIGKIEAETWQEKEKRAFRNAALKHGYYDLSVYSRKVMPQYSTSCFHVQIIQSDIEKQIVPNPTVTEVVSKMIYLTTIESVEAKRVSKIAKIAHQKLRLKYHNTTRPLVLHDYATLCAGVEMHGFNNWESIFNEFVIPSASPSDLQRAWTEDVESVMVLLGHDRQLYPLTGYYVRFTNSAANRLKTLFPDENCWVFLGGEDIVSRSLSGAVYMVKSHGVFCVKNDQGSFFYGGESTPWHSYIQHRWQPDPSLRLKVLKEATACSQITEINQIIDIMRQRKELRIQLLHLEKQLNVKSKAILEQKINGI